MNDKDVFLIRLKEQIAEGIQKVNGMQSFYDEALKLPNEFFTNLMASEQPVPTNISKPNIPYKITGSSILKAGVEISEDLYKKNEYGKNKRMLIQILTENNKVMIKADIRRKFAELSGKSEEEVSNAVTNVIAQTNTDGDIKGYKPEELTFRGKFWGLPSWYDGENIKKEFAPYQGEVKML